MEANIEKQMYLAVKKLNGRCIKLNPMWNIGIPDRMILLPMGRVYFIELKHRSKVSKAQVVWIKWLNNAGFDARVIRGKIELDIFLKEIEDDEPSRHSSKDIPSRSPTSSHREVAGDRDQGSAGSRDDGAVVRDSSYVGADRNN